MDMKKTICPYLGLREDPKTSLSFPSQGNACHRANPVAPVEADHQEKFCLGPGYKACPIYQAVETQPVPAMFAAPAFLKDQRKRRLALIAIPFAAAGVMVLGMAMNSLVGKFGLLGASRIPQTGASNQASSLGWFSGFDQPTPFLQNSPASSTPSLKAICAYPEGWVTYVVNPTDSLFRLSVVYGITVEELQKANCMGKDTVILPGQVIYVPFLPSPTPSATSTAIVVLPTQTLPRANNVAPAANQPEQKSEDKPVVQPNATPVPPTKVPQPPKAKPPEAKPPEVKPTEKPKPPEAKPPQESKPPKEVKPTEAPKPKQEPKPQKTDKPKGGKKGGGGGKKGGG